MQDKNQPSTENEKGITDDQKDHLDVNDNLIAPEVKALGVSEDNKEEIEGKLRVAMDPLEGRTGKYSR